MRPSTCCSSYDVLHTESMPMTQDPDDPRTKRVHRRSIQPRMSAGQCGSPLHALSAALGPGGDLSTSVTHRELARRIADKLDSVVQEGPQRIGDVNILDLVTWGRLPDAVVDDSEIEPKNWPAL